MSETGPKANMSERIYTVTWECLSCGREHSFRYALKEFGDWPNRFGGLVCENEDCGRVQEIPSRKMTIEPFSL